MNITLNQETIDNATNDALSNLLKADNYSNPIKKILESEFSWDLQGNGKTELGKSFKLKVEQTLISLMDSPEFQTKLGEVIIQKFAESCIKDLRNLKEISKR